MGPPPSLPLRSLGLEGLVSEAKRATRQYERYDRRSASHRSAFAKSNMAPDWVRNDPDLALAWVLDRSVTTAEATTRRRCRLYDELA